MASPEALLTGHKPCSAETGLTDSSLKNRLAMAAKMIGANARKVM